MLASLRLQRLSFLVPLVKWAVLLLTLFYLYRTVGEQREESGAWLGLFWRAFQGEGKGLVWLAVALVPVNWGLEARKWQLLARKVERVSFGPAYRAVVIGLCLGFVTPNRVGDYAGRILALRTSRRAEAVGAVFLGRISQMLITLAAGSLSLFFMANHMQEGYLPVGWTGAGLLTAFAALLLFLGILYSRVLLRLFHPTGFLRPLSRYLDIIATYSRPELGQVLGISALRYAVFSLQFGLLLLGFGLELPLAAGVAGIAGTYLLKSVLPSFNALGDIGLREVSALYFFSFIGQPHLPVLSASLSLWLLNIALPTVLGLFFVLRLKVRT